MAIDEHDDIDGPTLALLSSKRFPHAQPIKFPFTAYSSPHDLLAIVNINNDISIFRITSGQVAFNVKRENATKQGIEVTAISWKADSACLGVGWSDGKYGIYDGGSGKQLALSELSAEDGEATWRLALPSASEVEGEEDQKKKAESNAAGQEEDDGNREVHPKAQVLGWMGHVSGLNEKTKHGIASMSADWLNGDGAGTGSLSAKGSAPKLAELTRAITTLDVIKALPRLSAVQNHITKPARGMGKTQKVSSVWQTQQGTDSIFEIGKDMTAKDTVEGLLVCQDNGTVHVLIDETVRVGSFDISGKPLLHAAHHQSSHHAIVSCTDDEAYFLNTIDMPLDTLGGPLLHVIATNTKRMQTLLDYIVQAVRCIQFDYHHNIDVPARFMRSLGGFVEDTDLPDIVANFYHLAMTGTFPDQLLEWLKDVLQDRGQKRWEEHMNDMYSHIQHHLFVNLLPALERFSIAGTTLRGHATFYEGSNKFDCTPQLFTNVLDQIDCLRLVAQKMLLIIQTEHRQLRAFNKWMKMQMEVAAAEPFTSSALETESREVPSLDYSLLLQYIQDVMTESKLAVHIKDRPQMQGSVSSEEFWSNSVIRDSSYSHAQELLQRETTTIQSRATGKDMTRDTSYRDDRKSDPRQPMSLSLKDVEDRDALLNLPAITCALVGHVRVVLKKITDWQSRMLPDPTSVPLDIAPGSIIQDMTMTMSEESAEATTRILAAHPTDPMQIGLITSSPSTKPVTIFVPLPPCSELLSVKWIAHTQAQSFLTLSKVDVDDEGNFQTQVRRHNLAQGQKQTETLNVFPGSASFRPQSLLVGGRKGKMVCVVFGNKGREWRVLDLGAGPLQSDLVENEDAMDLD